MTSSGRLNWDGDYAVKCGFPRLLVIHCGCFHYLKNSMLSYFLFSQCCWGTWLKMCGFELHTQVSSFTGSVVWYTVDDVQYLSLLVTLTKQTTLFNVKHSVCALLWCWMLKSWKIKLHSDGLLNESQLYSCAWFQTVLLVHSIVSNLLSLSQSNHNHYNPTSFATVFLNFPFLVEFRGNTIF